MMSPGMAATGKRLVLLLAAAASAGYICRVAITVVAPGIMRDYGLTQAQMGTVFSAFLIGYTRSRFRRAALPIGSAHAVFSSFSVPDLRCLQFLPRWWDGAVLPLPW